MLRAPAVAVALVGVIVGLARPAHAQGPRTLDLKFGADGLVTLSAQNVTVRDILAEWARQCGCYVVNADRLAGPPLAVPIAFVSAPQPAVLRTLLRETGGYALTPRRADSTSVSQYETIYIINPSGPVAYTSPAAAITPIAIRSAPDDEIPPVMPIVIGAEPPAPGTPNGEQPGSQTQTRPANPTSGFVITPLSPVSTTPVTTVTPGQPAQPGRATPAPQR